MPAGLRNLNNGDAVKCGLFESVTAIALIGPTATGKSRLALALAAQIGGEIISVDSGAVYREMSIGTAKPTADDQQRAPHHLIDIRNPDDFYNVGSFVSDARAAMTQIAARGATPIFAGGTMMYANALARGLAEIPPVDDEAAAAVEREMTALGTAESHRQLAAIDAETAGRIAAGDRQRIHRALCVWRATGKPLSYWLRRGGDKPANDDIRWVALMPADREALRRRIGERLARMWADGLLAETEAVITKWHLAADAPPLRLAGYRQAAARLRGSIGESAMRQQAFFATCQLAKRQIGWLRRWQTALIVDPQTADESQIAAILNRPTE